MAVRPNQLEDRSRGSPDLEVGSPAAPASSLELERQRLASSFLRQVMSGLSTFRLFPGDLEQAAFVQACERVQTAAEALLEHGPVDIDLHGNRASIGGFPLPPDDRVEKLSLICYQHRAERLTVQSAPDRQDLAVLYESLGRPVGEGGIGAALRVAGVEALSVVEYTPAAQDPDHPGGHTTVDQRRVWDLFGNPAEMATELVDRVRTVPTAAEAATAVFEHLKELVRRLPPHQANGFELYRRLQEVMAKLPRGLRKAMTRLLVERIQDEPLALRLVGTMTDASLARLLVELQGGPETPVALATRLWEGGVRRDDLVDLTIALMSGHEEGGTIIAGVDKVLPSAFATQMLAPTQGDQKSPVARTVSSLLARGLVSMGQEDIRSVRERYPSDADQIRVVALDALYDYLRMETDSARFGEVLGMWVHETIEALLRRDQVRLGQLRHAIGGAMEEAGEKHALADASLTRVLHQDNLRQLISPVDSEVDLNSTVVILGQFGELSVEALLEDLATEDDRGRRAMLLAVLGQVARGHHTLVASRLSDDRWYVARNSVSILQRIGTAEVVPFLSHALHHASPAVRREAVRALVAVSGEDSLVEILEAAHDQDGDVRAAVVSSLGGMVDPWVCRALSRAAVEMREPAERRAVVEALARHPTAEAERELERLAGNQVRPRLPRRVRRHARTLLKTRRAGR